MEKLTPDVKFLLAERLSGTDLVKLCATDQNMRKICQSSRYNSIWQEKLKQDYDIDYRGDNSYMMYLQAVYFHNREKWLVIGENDYNSDDKKIFLFTSREAAINHIISKQRDPTWFAIGELDRDGEYSDGDVRWFLRKVDEVGQSRNSQARNYVQEYEDELKKIGKTLLDPESGEDFIDDLKFDISEKLSVDEIVESIQEAYPFGEETETAIRNLLQ